MEHVADRNLSLRSHGLESLDLARHLMDRPHRHNDIELNFIESGSMTYLLGGSTVVFDAGKLYVFWAAMPHQIIQTEEATRHRVLTVPLNYFLRFGLPDHFMGHLLHGHPVVDPEPENTALNRLHFQCWHRYLRAARPEYTRITLLEVEACLRRLALLNEHREADGSREPGTATSSMGHVERMVAHISRAYQESLTVEDVAAAAGLHPNYAMQLFRKHLNITIVDYLTQYRVAHAQRLLVTGDGPVVDIALACGFGSLSRFYAVFKKICGQSPSDYRRSIGDSRQITEKQIVTLLSTFSER